MITTEGAVGERVYYSRNSDVLRKKRSRLERFVWGGGPRGSALRRDLKRIASSASDIYEPREGQNREPAKS